MVTIRLSRAGAKKTPFYRVVVTNSRSPRDGDFLEKIGTWDARRGEGGILNIDLTRFDHWVKNGAQPSGLVAKLAKKARTAPAAAPAPKA